MDKAISVLLGQLAKALVAVDGLLVSLHLVLRDIAREVFSLFPGLAIVVRAIGTLAQDAKLSAFHVFDLSDLRQE